MDGLLEDRLRVIDLKLGLEVADMVRNTAAVGAAAGVGEGEVFVYNLFSESSPVALAPTVLLDLLGIDVGIAALGKETRKILDGESSALGNALMITIVGFVRTSHDGKRKIRWRIEYRE